MEASWHSIVLRQRFGLSMAKSLDPTPMLLGDPLSAVAFFAKSGGLSIDIGPAQEHVDAQDRGETRVIDRYRVGRSEVQVLAGQVRDLVSAEMSEVKGSRTKPARLLVHSPNSASVVVPRSKTKRGEWALVLTDSGGNSIRIANSNR